jgi:hypothetical protein
MSQITPTVLFGLDDQPPPSTRWLWHGLLGPGKLTLLTSLWKSGKTTLVAHLLARRRHGGDFLGLPVAPGGTLIVSEEGKDLWADRARFHALGAGVALLSRPFDGRPTVAPMQQLADQAVALNKERGVDLVVIDSLAVFLAAKTENEASVVVDAFAPFVAMA